MQRQGEVHTEQRPSDHQWRRAWRHSKEGDHLTLSSASSFSSCAFSCLTVSSSAFKCSTSSALDAFRYCLMKLQSTTQRGQPSATRRGAKGLRPQPRPHTHGQRQAASGQRAQQGRARRYDLLQGIGRLLAGLVERHQHCKHQARGTITGAARHRHRHRQPCSARSEAQGCASMPCEPAAQQAHPLLAHRSHPRVPGTSGTPPSSTRNSAQHQAVQSARPSVSRAAHHSSAPRSVRRAQESWHGWRGERTQRLHRGTETVAPPSTPPRPPHAASIFSALSEQSQCAATPNSGLP